MKNAQKGITLIALVVTIIVLIILAGVTINLLFGDVGIISKTKYSKILWDMRSTLEKIKIAGAEDSINSSLDKLSKNTDIIYNSESIFNNRLTEQGKKKVLKYENIFTGSNNKEIKNKYYEIRTRLYENKDNNIYIYNKENDYIVELSKEDYEPLKSVWFWCSPSLPDEYKYIINETERKNAIDTFAEKNYSVIYLSMDYKNLDNYTDFIEYANEKNLNVYALFGDPLFIYNDYSDGIYNYIDAIKQYNDKHDIKIKQIHYDVEPHAIVKGNYPNLDSNKYWVDGETESAKKAIVRSKFVEFVQVSTEYAHKNNIQTGYDITFWIDRYSYYNAKENKYKNIGEEIVRVADNITIMDFGTKPDYILANVIDKKTYTYDDKSSIEVTENWIEKCLKYDTELTVGMDLETFKNEAKKKEDAFNNNKEEYNILVPTYIPADYEYTRKYVEEKIIKESQNRISNYVIQNKYKGINLGYAIHHAYTWLDLIKNY